MRRVLGVGVALLAGCTALVDLDHRADGPASPSPDAAGAIDGGVDASTLAEAGDSSPSIYDGRGTTDLSHFAIYLDGITQPVVAAGGYSSAPHPGRARRGTAASGGENLQPRAD